MYRWTVKNFIDKIKVAKSGDLNYVATDRSRDDRSSVWKYADGFWARDVEGMGDVRPRGGVFEGPAIRWKNSL